MKQSNKKNLLVVSLVVIVCLGLYNNCADGFKTEDSLSVQLASSQGGDDGGFRPLPVTTTTTTTIPNAPITTTTTMPAVTLVSCAEAQYQLPIATHWSNAGTGSVVEGSSDQIRIENAEASSPRVYINGFLPEFEKYIGDTYSIGKYDDAGVKQWSLELCQKNGIAVDIRKPASYSNWNVAKQAAVAKRGALQILPALKVNKSLIDIILPVGWDPNAAAGTYPVIFVGAYDVHDTMKTEGQIEVSAIASLWNTKKLKAIGIVWNGMGAINSRTMNDGALPEFNSLIQKAAVSFGADPQRIITFGGSRGGTTSLRIASNPNNYPYKVVAAYAAVPPDQTGNIGRLISSTVPALLFAAEWTIGLKSVFMPGWTYPNLGNSLTGLTAKQAHLKILTGITDLDLADANYSMSSTRFIQGLKSAGTQVYLEIGSHDFIVPWIDQFRYAKVLDQYGIPNELRINYMAGHWRDNAAVEQILTRVLSQVATKTGGNYFSIGAKSYYRFDTATGSMRPVNKPMFTIEFPRKIVPGSGGQIIATGIPATKYKISFRYNGGDLIDAEQTLDSEGKHVWDISGIDDGTYQIEKLFIQEPGRVMTELSINRKTTKYGNGFLKLEKTSTPFTGTSGDLTVDIMHGYLGASMELANGPEMTNVSYGVCE